SMDLDRFLGSAQRRGDLLVDLARDELAENLTLARCQSGDPLDDSVAGNRGGTLRGVNRQGLLHGCEQFPGVDGLGEKVDGATLHGAYAFGDVSLATEEHDGAAAAAAAQGLLQLQATHLRHGQVEDEAAGSVLEVRVRLQKLACGFEGACLVSRRSQQTGECRARLGVVVDDIQCPRGWAHTGSPCDWRNVEDGGDALACALARSASSRCPRRAAARLSQATISSRISRTSPVARSPPASSRCAAWALLRIADSGWRNSCARVSSVVTEIQPPCASGAPWRGAASTPAADHRNRSGSNCSSDTPGARYREKSVSP